jgi:hypothetical protein
VFVPFYRFIATSTRQTAKTSLRLMAQITWSGTRRCLFEVSLNKTFTRNFSFLISYRSGPVKWTSLQAYAVQGRLIGLPAWARRLFQFSDRNNNEKSFCQRFSRLKCCNSYKRKNRCIHYNILRPNSITVTRMVYCNIILEPSAYIYIAVERFSTSCRRTPK